MRLTVKRMVGKRTVADQFNGTRRAIADFVIALWHVFKAMGEALIGAGFGELLMLLFFFCLVAALAVIAIVVGWLLYLACWLFSSNWGCER